MPVEQIDTVRIGVPSKGRLYDGSVNLLQKSGFAYQKRPRELNATTVYTNPRELYRGPLGLVKIRFMNQEDILDDVAEGCLDLGIVGGDMVREIGYVQGVQKLDFGRCTFSVLAPFEFKPVNPSDKPKVTIWDRLRDLQGLRVATSYPTIAQEYLQQAEVEATLVRRRGAVEGVVKSGRADAALDIVETGATIEDNDLKRILDLEEWQAQLVANEDYQRGRDRFVEKVIDRLSDTNTSEYRERLKRESDDYDNSRTTRDARR